MWRQTGGILRPGRNYIGQQSVELGGVWDRSFGCVPCAPGEQDESYYYIGNWLWSLGEFTRGLKDMTTMPLYWVGYH
jgi:hypothetical protein